MKICSEPERAKDEISFATREKQLAQITEEEAQQRRIAKKSPFLRWTQMNNEQTPHLIALAKCSPNAHALLYFLVDQMDSYNALVCSNTVIAEVLEVSPSTVSRLIRILSDRGFIAVYRTGRGNVFAINDSVFWKSWGNKIKFSKFPANVILSSTEQKQYKKSVEPMQRKEILLKNGCNLPAEASNSHEKRANSES